MIFTSRRELIAFRIEPKRKNNEKKLKTNSQMCSEETVNSQEYVEWPESVLKEDENLRRDGFMKAVALKAENEKVREL